MMRTSLSSYLSLANKSRIGQMLRKLRICRCFQTLEGMNINLWKNVTGTIVLLLFIVSCTTSSDGFLDSGTSEPLQHDFDIARLNDLKNLGGMIEEYKDKTGRYPLEGISNVPNYVHIATKNQQKFVKGKPPYSHKITDVNEFILTLQEVLGNDIKIPFDPQKIPVNKPNFYIYKISGDIYYLAVHVFEEYEFSKNVAKYYNKVEVTNSPQRSKGAWLYDELISNSTFEDAISKTPNKPGYVEQLRNKMGNNNAF